MTLEKSFIANVFKIKNSNNFRIMDTLSVEPGFVAEVDEY